MRNKICGYAQAKAFIWFMAVATILALTAGCAPRAVTQPSTASETVVSETDYAAQQEAASESAVDNQITGIRIRETPDAWIVMVTANHTPDYTLAESPLAQEAVLYFAESLLGVDQTEFPSESDLIGTVSAVDLIKNGPCKVVIPVLQPGIDYKARRGSDANVIEVVFTKPEPDRTTGEELAETAGEPLAGPEGETAGETTALAEEEAEAASPARPEPAPLTAEAETAQPAPPATKMEGIQSVTSENGVEVKINANGTIEKYKSFTLTNPPRIVFDLPGVRSSYLKEQKFPVGSDMVQQVRHFSHPNYLRVVLDVNEAVLSQFEGIPRRDGLLIQVGETAQTSAMQTAATAPEDTEVSRADVSVPAEMAETENVAEESEAVSPAPESSAMAEQTAEEAISPEAAAPQPEAKPAEPAESAQKGSGTETVDSSAYDRPALVNKIDFITQKDGRSILEVGTTHPVNYDLTRTGDKKLQLTLQGTDILSFRQRPLITTRFDSAVDVIMPLQKQQMKQQHISIFNIVLREDVGYATERDGNLIQVHFEPSAVAPDPAKKVVIPTDYQLVEKTEQETEVIATAEPLPATQTEEEAAPAVSPEQEAAVMEEETPPEAAAVTEETQPEPVETTAADKPADRPEEAAAEEEAAVSPAEEEDVPSLLASRKKKTYTGEPIALDFYKTDIRNVIRILKDVSGKNFAIDKDVTGSVTLSFINPVPWDQVLDLILEMNDLGMVERQGIVRIATQETLRMQKEAAQAALAAEQELKKTEETLAPVHTEYFAISYADAQTEILPHIEPLLTERGHAKVDSRTNQVIMTDVEDRIDKAREVIAKIDQVTPQVMIKARIVETTSDFSREIGTHWGARNFFLSEEEFGATIPEPGTKEVAGKGGEAFAQSIWPGTYVDDIDGMEGTYSYGVALNNLTQPVSNLIGIDFAKIVGTPFSLDARLSLMESEGEGKIISTPKIVTLDNKTALISQGEEIPYSTVSADGTETEFKDAELELEVTPHVTPDNRISMKIHVTQKEPVAGFGDEPPLNTKEAQTELLVNDGDTVVIGGIMQQSTRNSVSGIPWISKIPVLGNLFKFRSAQDDKDELLIFITPSIVRLD